MKLRPQLLLDYKLAFGEAPPEDRIAMIQHISKKSILFEITALNYRLKQKDRIHIDVSFETQKRELIYFTQTPELYKKYGSIAEKYSPNKKSYVNIFNRQACLFAIEEIINCESMIDIEDFQMSNIDVWESIIKYLLAVNYVITQIKKEKDENNVSFEILNPKLLPLNELSVETDPLYTIYRGYLFIKYLLENSEYATDVNEYFLDVYGVEYDFFIFDILSMYLSNKNENPEHDFYYLLQDNQIGIFEILSTRLQNTEVFKLLSIRKSPFVNVEKNKYILSDNIFLVEKTYNQFINDFWFDRLKKVKDEAGRNKYNIQNYRSVFGYFFENYLRQIFKKCFENYKYSVLLLFDDLKITSPRGGIEIADLYLRNNNNILLGQVKSGNIYDKEKYGGDVDSLYRNDRNSFFDNFGVNQLVNSIKFMDEHISLKDNKFPKGQSYEIYPCIIVNDKAFQTPLMADTFNKRFQELAKEVTIRKVKINPLSLIHVNDLERIEELLNENPKKIWDMLKNNTKVKAFIPPFFMSISHFNLGRKYAERVFDLYKKLINKFNPTDNDIN